MKGIFFIFLTIFLWGCGVNNLPKEIIESEKVEIKYKNGNLYCEGLLKVIKKEASVKKSKIGVWKYYYLDGNNSRNIEYDDKGRTLNMKDYNENKQLEYSLVTTEINTQIKTHYFEGGNIEQEEIIENEFNTKTKKVYYKNGQLKSATKYLIKRFVSTRIRCSEDEIQGKKVWDENGNLILDLKYEGDNIVANSSGY